MNPSRGSAANPAPGPSPIRALGGAIASLGAAALFVAGCSGVPGDGAEPGTAPSEPSPGKSAGLPPADLGTGSLGHEHEHGSAFPNVIPADADVLRAWVPGPTGPVLVDYVVIDGWAITEGDILLGRADEIQPIAPGEEDAPPPAMEKGAYRTTGLWPGGVVRYSSSGLAFNFSPEQQATILSAMQTWTNATGIQFQGVAGRVVTGDYIAFVSGSTCTSAVGRIGGQQNLISGGCTFESTVHELGHALGLYHEHLRTDRDTFVSVFESNVVPASFTRNFARWVDQSLEGADALASTACGIPAYDFDSQMHYGTWDFSANGWPTMVRIADSNVNGASSRIYKRTSLVEWKNINGTGISNTKLGYGLFNANASADLFRSDGAWFFSSGATAPWTSLRTEATVYRKNRTSTQLVLGDFDGNGRTDAMRESGNAWQVSWNATGAFTTLNADARLNGVVKRPADVTTGDFDGDEKTDILAASGGNYFVRYGGVGAWQLYVDLPAALPDPWTLGYGDFNGDNITDMFRVNGTTWELLVVNPILGSSWEVYNSSVPAGPLNQSLAHGTFTPSIALGDFDGDGLTDVLFTDGVGSAGRTGSMRYARTALGDFSNPFVFTHVFMSNILTPLHFNNFNFNFVHTCKTLSSGPNAGARRCHSGSDVDGDGVTDILSTQVAPVERGTKPTLSAGDILTVCNLYAASLTCDSSCPTAVP